MSSECRVPRNPGQRRQRRPAARRDRPAAYAADHVDLGYAVTTHRAQGLTVDTAHVVVFDSTTRENLYVAMTRGRDSNVAYVVNPADDNHGGVLARDPEVFGEHRCGGRIRRALLTGEEKLDEVAQQRLHSPLELGDPAGEVALAYRVKERLREFYRSPSIEAATSMLADLIDHCAKPTMPSELRKLARTLKRWFEKICNYHHARISNGPTEALNNLIKPIKRIGFGFRNFDNYRIRALLYAGKPNWRTLKSIVVT